MQERKPYYRYSILTLFVTGAVMFSFFFISARPVGATFQEKPPNIIFLLTDDQRWDAMGAMGNPIIQTPNMDDMAENGVLFKNAFVTTAICAVSRASILSGQYARRHGIHNFKTNFSDSAYAHTYPMLLRQAGYRTGFIGKYGVGEADELPKNKFDYWQGFGGQGYYEHEDENGNYKHLTQIMGEQAVDFLKGSSNDKPFCLSISFKAPHVQDEDSRQYIYGPAYKDVYKNATIPVPETADSRYFNSLPRFLQQSEARRRWKIRFSTSEKYQESVKGYYRLITGVDVVIGQIRDELKKLNFDDNTIIVLMGDNGYYLGEHGLAGKWFGHEESIRIPLLIYDPRFPSTKRGQEFEEMALNIDIAPTLLSMAGVAIPEKMQGYDLTDLINGEDVMWRNDFFYEHLFHFKTLPKSEGVVSKRYKYLKYIEQKPGYEVLYDLKNDAFETNNLARNIEYLEILEIFRNRYDVLRREVQ